MAFTKVAPAGIGSTPGDGYRIGDSFLHSSGVEITNINATGILTAASLDISGAIDFDGHTELDNVNISGVSTFAGNIDANGDLDVDGHTNLDNLSVAGVSTFSGIVAAGVGSTAVSLDNGKMLTFGSEHELEMFHDGSQSYIKQRWHAYPSALNIISENSQINIMSGSGGNAHGGYENAIQCLNNGATKIYHAGVGPYFETYGAGVMFQGNIQVGQDITHHGDADTKIKFPALNTISFETTGSERLRILSGGSVNIGGDYTQTSQKLKVTGNTTIDGTLTVGVSFICAGGYSINSGNVTQQGYTFHDADSDTYFGFPSNDQFAIFTAGTQRLKIFSNGNSDFDVAGGTLKVTGTGAYGLSIHNTNSPSMGHLFIYGDNGLIRFRNSSNTYTAQIGYTESSNTLFLNNQEAGTPLYILADGAKLDDNKKFIAGNSNDLQIYHSTDNYIKSVGSSQNLIFDVNSDERLRIFSNGSVGVGDYSSTNLTHAFQALRTSGSTYVSSKNTGGNALFYAEASNGNTAKLELMQAGTGNFTLEVGSTNALMFKDDGTERLRIESGGTLFSKSPSDATPNFKFISDDTNWHGYLNQTVHGTTISTILSCGGTWTVDGVTYAATKDYNGSFGTAALIVHNQYSGTATGGELVFVTKANGSSTTDGAVTERFRIKSDGTVNCLGTAALTVPVGTTAQRPSSLATGMMRYNTTTTQLELYGGNGWFNVMDGIGQVGTASNPAESGKQLKDLGRSSGNYYIKPKGYSGSAIQAYVDMTTNGGGWVLVAAFPLQHSGLTMSGNTGGLNESSVKNYATTVPSNSNAAFYNKNFINYLFHQNATNDSNSTYSIAGVHGRSGNGYILWEIKAQSTHTNSSTDAFTTIYKTSDANNNFDVRYVTNSSNTLNYYVGTSSGEFNSYANYNDGRGGTSDGGNNYHYLIDDITGGYEWAFRENSDDNPGDNNGYNLSNIFIR